VANPPKNINLQQDEIKSVAWRSPSNIAMVKYWGKKGHQIPANPSLSMTLSKSHTETTVNYQIKEGKGIQIEYYFEGKRYELFEKRVIKYLESLVNYLPFLEDLQFSVQSSNSFPHSAGIASSASSMSALALCLCSIKYELIGETPSAERFLNEASFFARLGSGSACRSVFEDYVVWGKTNQLKGSSDEYAVNTGIEIDEEFKTLKDCILIVDPSEKPVSSRDGHAMIQDHFFAEQRFKQAHHNLALIMDAMKTGNWEVFINTVENEALTLHSLMMSSPNAYILLQPGTLGIIKKIRQFRKQNRIPVCFTLDAGPNVHLLYPYKYEMEVDRFIQDELKKYCKDGQMIKDGIGQGPEKLK
jgi:diphosphomevalonate decarboxylase